MPWGTGPDSTNPHAFGSVCACLHGGRSFHARMINSSDFRKVLVPVARCSWSVYAHASTFPKRRHIRTQLSDFCSVRPRRIMDWSVWYTRDAHSDRSLNILIDFHRRSGHGCRCAVLCNIEVSAKLLLSPPHLHVMQVVGPSGRRAQELGSIGISNLVTTGWMGCSRSSIARPCYRRPRRIASGRMRATSRTSHHSTNAILTKATCWSCQRRQGVCTIRISDPQIRRL